MNKVIEQMMMEREPVHQKCLGIGFSDEEKEFLQKEIICSRVEPVEIYEIIDEETGETDPEVMPTISKSDPACRCTTYMKPSVWWRHPGQRCPMADHYRPDLSFNKTKGRVGQQKQKKKGRK